MAFSKAHKLALSKAAKALYAKKRGVKPGTKRGSYKRSRKDTTVFTSIPNEKWRELNGAKFIAVTEPPKYTPTPILTLCGQLEDAILLLENRISNSIAKINSLM